MSGDPASIETTYVNSFKSGIEQGFKQMESVFDPYIIKGTQKSEFDFADRMGELDAPEKDVTRFGDNPMNHAEFDRRRIVLEDWDNGVPIDPKDLIRVATDPKAAITQELLRTFKVLKDDYFLERYFGDAKIGKKGEKTINYVHDASTEDYGYIAVGKYSNGSSNKVTNSTASGNGKMVVVGNDTSNLREGITVGSKFGGLGKAVESAATGLTTEKLKGLRATFTRLEAIEPGQLINLFITHQQFNDLLNLSGVGNMDTATKRSLEDGLVTKWMGFRFIHSERLPITASGERRLVAMASQKAFQMNIGGDTHGDMWTLPGKKKIPYIYAKLCMGGTRNWGEVSAEIRASEA